MIVTFHKKIDWEPLKIQLSGRDLGSAQEDEIRTVVKQWLKNRDWRPICKNDCKTKYLNVRRVESVLEICIEWMCRDCLDQFLKMIAAKFPAVEAAVVGDPEAEHGRLPSDRQFVQIPSRSVKMEDGQQLPIAPFSISHYPVSVGEFEAFVSETGYLTIAELIKYFANYRNNGTLYGMTASNHDRFEALFMSYLDAMAYCQHRKMRLPSDPELLAAITVDDDIRDISGNDRAALFRASPQLLHMQGNTLTSTLEGDKVVVRSGPWVTKQPGWDAPGKYRTLRPQNIPIGHFYVVNSHE